MSSSDDRQDPLRNPEGGSASAGQDPWNVPPYPDPGANPDPGTAQWPGPEQGGYGQTGPAGLPQPDQPQPGYGTYGPPAHGQEVSGAPGYGPGPYGSDPYGQEVPGAPGYGPVPYGPSPYGQGGYGPPGYWQGYQPPRPTNGMAVASLVLGIIWIYWLGSILALIFGYQARRQIAERGEAGGGLATAGIVLGWVGLGVLALVVTFGVIGVIMEAS